MEWLIAAGAVWLVLFFWFVGECRRAPLGYQDENGFHEVDAGRSLEDDLRRTREEWAAEKRERRHPRRSARA